MHLDKHQKMDILTECKLPIVDCIQSRSIATAGKLMRILKEALHVKIEDSGTLQKS
jgi:hypothetical protein